MPEHATDDLLVYANYSLLGNALLPEPGHYRRWLVWHYSLLGNALLPEPATTIPREEWDYSLLGNALLPEQVHNLTH